MSTCENMIGVKQCGHDAIGRVFGIDMCSSCITRELNSLLVEEYLQEVMIDPVTTIRSLVDAGVRHFVKKDENSILSPIKLSADFPKFTRGKVLGKRREGYYITAASQGVIGTIIRDRVRGLWLVIPKGGKSVVDAAGSVEVAARILWSYYRKGGLS